MRMEQCPLCGKAQPVAADPLKAQAATPGKLARLTRGLTRAQLLHRPAPGKWSIHMVQIERIRKALKSRERGTRRSAGVRTASERRVAASRGEIGAPPTGPSGDGPGAAPKRQGSQ